MDTLLICGVLPRIHTSGKGNTMWGFPARAWRFWLPVCEPSACSRDGRVSDAWTDQGSGATEIIRHLFAPATW